MSLGITMTQSLRKNFRLTTTNNPTTEDDCINRIIHFTLKSKKKYEIVQC